MRRGMRMRITKIAKGMHNKMITQKSKKIIHAFSEAVVREIISSEEINMRVDAYENYSNDHQICYNDHQICYNFAWNLFNEIQVRGPL